MLTTKQENFCLAYIETGNASEAYKRHTTRQK
ncbi:terminase small subunit [Providencia hangzhouensis]